MDRRRRAMPLGLLGGGEKAWSVAFNGGDEGIDGGSDASIDNLADNAITAEAWIKLYSFQNGAQIMAKGFGAATGWGIQSTGSGVTAFVYCATTAATCGNIAFTLGEWNHVAITFDDAGDRKLRFWINGVLVDTSGAADGAVLSDAASSLIIGGIFTGFTTVSNIGWVRISNSVRYTVDFVKPPRITPPMVDVNTVRLFKMNEGSGTAIIDYSANAKNATLTPGAWLKS